MSSEQIYLVTDVGSETQDVSVHRETVAHRESENRLWVTGGVEAETGRGADVVVVLVSVVVVVV